MNISSHNKSGRNRQTGAVLIVSMVILLVMTLIGVSAIQTTSMETKMAGNTQFFANAFQAAESAIERAIDDDLGFKTNTIGLVYSTNYHTSFGANTNSTVEFRYDDYNTLVIGSSMNKMVSHAFNLRASGTVANATAINNLGVTITSPAAGSI